MTDVDLPICKIVIIGDSSVGKSSVFQRFLEKKFSENTMPTLGVDYKIRVMDISGRFMKMMIWDTSGQEKYNAISKSFYTASDGVMILFSLTDKESFDNVSKWLEKAYNELPKDVPILLIGNKSDDSQNRAIDFETVSLKAKTLKLPYFETSAKDGTNVNEAFLEMGRRIIKRRNEIGTDGVVGSRLVNSNKSNIEEPTGGCSC